MTRCIIQLTNHLTFVFKHILHLGLSYLLTLRTGIYWRLKETPGRPDLPDPQDQLGRLAQQDQVDLREATEMMARLVQRGLLVPQDLLVPQYLLVHRVQMEATEVMVQQVQLDPQQVLEHLRLRQDQ